MLNKESVYLSALLHDIGKFIERAKDYYDDTRQIEKDFEVERKYSHRLYSAFFAEKFKYKDFLKDGSILKSVLFHHAADAKSKQMMDSDLQTKLVRIADDLASGERTEIDSSIDDITAAEDYYKARLLSIFSRIYNFGKNKYYDICELQLNRSNLIALSDVPLTDENRYKQLVKSFFADFEKNGKYQNLLSLLEKYLWCVPSETKAKDISLFDHSRAVASIALCLYHENKSGMLTDDDIKSYHKVKEAESFVIKPDKLKNKKLFLLVNGDMSGIQGFIFDIVNDRAGKSLKGRSFYLQLLTEIICRYIIAQLGLEQTNVLYNGGGNFYILIPASSEKELQKCRKYITEVLLAAHQGQLYLAIGASALTMSDFDNFSDKWHEAAGETSKNKYKKFSELSYENVFESFYRVHEKKEDSEMYRSYQNFSDEIKSARYISISKCNPIKPEEITEYGDVYKAFGFEVELFDKETKINKNKRTYLLNDTGLNSNNAGFMFTVNEIDNSDFAALAKGAEGDDKLAILKMDVDNLGKLFQFGLPDKERSISRIAALSRSLRIFFEGYLNTIIDKPQYTDEGKRLIYTIYSGGDDILLIGPYNKVIDLALEIKKEFDFYVCSNPKFTLSASVTIIDEKFPLLQGAMAAEDALTEAKHKDEDKNKISLFSEVFTWDEMDQLTKISGFLYDLIESKDDKKKESRALLQKVKNSTIGFKSILNKSNKGILDIEKMWRLRYYLRNMKKANEDEKKRLIKLYEDILLKNFVNGKKVSNIMLLPSAARLTELLTKSKES